QLGQTMLKGGHSRSVLWTSIGSFAALGLIVQTPGLSQLFGCRPLGPIGWGLGISSSVLATAMSPVIDTVVLKTSDAWELVRPRKKPEPTSTREETPEEIPENVVLLSEHAARLLRN